MCDGPVGEGEVREGPDEVKMRIGTSRGRSAPDCPLLLVFGRRRCRRPGAAPRARFENATPSVRAQSERV